MQDIVGHERSTLTILAGTGFEEIGFQLRESGSGLFGHCGPLPAGGRHCPDELTSAYHAATTLGVAGRALDLGQDSILLTCCPGRTPVEFSLAFFDSISNRANFGRYPHQTDRGFGQHSIFCQYEIDLSQDIRIRFQRLARKGKST